MKFKLIRYLVIGALFSGCGGGSKAPVVTHVNEEKTEIRVSGESTTASPTLPAENPFPVSTSSKDAKVFLTEAKVKYLDIQTWENQSVSQGDHFRSFINHVHSNLLVVQPSERWPELVSFYQKFCNQDFENCRFIDLLRSSPYSSDLFHSIGDLQSEIKVKYYFLTLAFEIKNNTSNDNLAASFLKDIVAYRSLLVEEKKVRILSKVDGLLKLLLPRVRSGAIQSADSSWMESLGLEKSIDPNDNYIVGQILTQKDGSKVIARPSLLQAIQTRQEKPQSYQSRYRWLISSMPALSKQLGIHQLESNVEFYVVDQLMNNLWSPKQAFAFMSGAGMNINAVADVGVLYVKTQIIYILAKCIEDLKAYHKSKGDKVSVRFFEDAKGLLITHFSSSRMLPERVSRLVDLALMTDAKSEGATELIRLKANLNQTLKSTLNDPLTFALIYMGQSAGLHAHEKIPLSKYTSEGLIPFNYLISKFWRGALPPLLDFTDDWESSTPLQIIESLEFTIKAGVYELMGGSADSGVSELLETYMQANIFENHSPSAAIPTKIFSIIDARRSIETIRQQEDFNFAINLCKGSQDKIIPGIKVLRLTDTIKSPTLGDFSLKLKSSGYSERGGTGGNTKGRIEWYYKPVNGSWTLQFEHFRLDTLPYLGQIEAVLNAAEAKGAKFLNSRKLILSLKNEIKSFILSYKSFFDQAEGCWKKLMLHERKTVVAAAQYEKKYWQWAVQKIKQGQPDAIKIFSSDLPQGVEYRTRLLEGGNNTEISLNTFDFLIRARHYIQFGIKELGLPPLDPSAKILFEANMHKQSLYSDAVTNKVTLTGAAETVLNDLTTGGGITKITDWFNSGFQPYDLYENEVDLATTMFKISPYLKQTLGIEHFYSAEEMFEVSRSSILSLNVQAEELATLQTIGKKSWFDPFATIFSVEKKWVMDDGKTPIPYVDFNLYLLSQPWMTDYGNKAKWENKHNDRPITRPENLVTLEKQAVKLFYHLTDLKNGKANIFSSQLTSFKEIESHYRTQFLEDEKNMNSIVTKINNLKPFDVQFVFDRVEHYEPYSRDYLNNMLAVMEQFHISTGGVFRP